MRAVSHDGLDDLAGEALYAGFDVGKVVAHDVDEHLVLSRVSGPAARASLWWRRTPALAGKRVGVVGHFGALDPDAAKQVLDVAAERLVAAGCTTAIGPMDGTTWRTYRFVTERGGEPPFFLEPDNPDAYPGWWESSSFVPFAGYTSALERDLTVRDPRMLRVAERLLAEDVVIRPIDLAHADDELARIHAVSLVSFAGNLLFEPVSLEEFAGQYRAVLPVLDPSLVLIAERQGEPVGFVLLLPDMARVARGEPRDTAIIKTVAVLPGRRFAGLGSLLVDRARERAREQGYERLVHALMHDSNASRRISDRFGTTIRRYTLYARELA